MRSGLVLVGFMLSVLLFSLIPSVCAGGEYATDRGSNMFGITGAFINAWGDLYVGRGGKPFTAILLMPHTAHFFARHLAVGGDLLLLLTTQSENKSTTLGVGPKIMYFFGGKDSKSYPYLTTGLYYLRNDFDYEDVDLLVQGVLSGTRFKVGAGVNWMIARHMALQVEASYNRDKLKHEDQEKSIKGNMAIVSIGLAGFTF